MLIGPQEDVAIRNRRCRITGFAQVIHSQDVKLFRISLKHTGNTSAARVVKTPGGHHDRAPAFTAFEPFAPSHFSGFAFDALSRSRSGVYDIKITTHHHP